VLLFAGIALFSGSLYALAFILGWLAFALAVIYARTPA
jgi:uncharacterized membrane protein YgdD (TMEM256/DUF423 family)